MTCVYIKATHLYVHNGEATDSYRLISCYHINYSKAFRGWNWIDAIAMYFYNTVV